jgi:F420-non-reducing hydrogenase iron-sulfur subunit
MLATEPSVQTKPEAEEAQAAQQEVEFEPRIVAFLCKWCSGAGADLAGTGRLRYPPNVLPIRVMCSSRVDANFVMRAFRDGADAVLVAGCHPGDCHYITGNYKTFARYHLVQKLMKQFGIEAERFRLEWVSASEGRRFAEVVAEVTETIRRLGPLNWKKQVQP